MVIPGLRKGKGENGAHGFSAFPAGRIPVESASVPAGFRAQAMVGFPCEQKIQRCTMNVRAIPGIPWAALSLLAGALTFLAGCDDSRFSREPPVGQGSVVVDNYTGDRLRVYVDGLEIESTSADDHRYYDLDPGLYRMALDGEDVGRSWAGDVDVLNGRRTVLEVRGYTGDYRSFDVRIYFD
jgi:hypothetical protein